MAALAGNFIFFQPSSSALSTLHFHRNLFFRRFWPANQNWITLYQQIRLCKQLEVHWYYSACVSFQIAYIAGMYINYIYNLCSFYRSVIFRYSLKDGDFFLQKMYGFPLSHGLFWKAAKKAAERKAAKVWLTGLTFGDLLRLMRFYRLGTHESPVSSNIRTFCKGTPGFLPCLLGLCFPCIFRP